MMKIRKRFLAPACPSLLALALLHISFGSRADSLESGWADPPRDARIRAYWWWLNGNVTKEAITRDLKEMKVKGWGGALICDAGGAEQDANDQVPHGPTFFTPEWRELYKHALHEAARLGLEMSLNIQSGWNLGGPMVKPEDAPKKLVWSEQRVSGPSTISFRTEQPKSRDGFYQDLFVMAYRPRQHPAGALTHSLGSSAESINPIRNLSQKALLKPLEPFSAPSSVPLFQEFPAIPGEEDMRKEDVLDLTRNLHKDGTLHWKVPPGEWRLFRFGCTLNDHCRVSTCSEGWQGYAIDPFDAGAFRRYWNAIVEPLVADAGPLAGKALKYLHTDSWEVEVANWTPTLRQEFRKRRGYDLLPWLPVIAGCIVNSRDESNRFLHDFRRTMGDLAIANHYQLFRDGAHRHGLSIHPESGGPHAVPIDAQQCLGFNDAPMSEFWARSWRHRIGDPNRFFVKQPASAAHTYGHKLVLAEGFTTIGPHWQETLWDNLKPAFDQACTEGLNLLVWHAFTCSPQSAGLPGQQYFAGTHMNPNVTWWDQSRPFIDYLNRCQFMLQQGLFVADVLYYYGNHVPNFTQLRSSDPARVGPGFDYDVITAEAILTRLTFKGGRLTLPDGMSYSLLVLPDRPVISLPVLKKIQKLVAGGASVIMTPPEHASGLAGFPRSDHAVERITKDLFGEARSPRASARPSEHLFHLGRIITGKTAREVLLADRIQPDFECLDKPHTNLNYVHRRLAAADLYFVANRSPNADTARVSFRVSGKAPELWDPVTGEQRLATAYEESEGRTDLPIQFPPCGSVFIVFRRPAALHPPRSTSNPLLPAPVQEIRGPWAVSFDPRWGAPASITFENLESWSDRGEPGIRFYSGKAMYRKEFELPPQVLAKADARVFIDLGQVRELAEIKVNGRFCGIAWTPPFRVDVTDAVRPGANELVITVANFWPNRLIGDASMPLEQRATKTNIRKFTPQTPLMQSGLLGPVTLIQADP
jgi:hypothetical protein